MRNAKANAMWRRRGRLRTPLTTNDLERRVGHEKELVLDRARVREVVDVQAAPPWIKGESPDDGLGALAPHETLRHIVREGSGKEHGLTELGATREEGTVFARQPAAAVRLVESWPSRRLARHAVAVKSAD